MPAMIPHAAYRRTSLRAPTAVLSAGRRYRGRSAFFAESAPALRLSCVAARDPIVRERPVLRDRIFYGLFETLRAKDPYTAAHSLRVERLARLLCRRIGLDAVTMHNVCAAAVLHDIGKLAVPDAVLTKPSRLTNSEFAVIKQHPADGEALLQFMPDYRALLPMIRHHHEWTDGSGYPDGLVGEAIPFSARVIQVADCIDAMAVSRSYAAARPVVEIIHELDRGAGTQFHTDLAQTAIAMLEAEPELLTSK